MNDVALINAIKPYTKTSQKRLEAMVASLRWIEEEAIDGDVVECGVWRAGNIMLARKIAPDRVCWLYDTFTGMTEPGPEDISISSQLPALPRYHASPGWCLAALEDVKSDLAVMDCFDEQRLRFVVGDVAETLLIAENLPDQIALLRLDTDWYASTKIELEVLYPRLVSGGVLIVDDYGHWQGSRQAVDEYFGNMVTLARIDYTAVMLVKP